MSYGPFHSEDLEGLFGTFPGLKLVYPSTVQDYFELLLASIYDDNPVLFFESKYLHRRIKGEVEFDGNVQRLQGARIARAGTDLTICAYGAMLHEAVAAAELAEERLGASIEIVDPRVLKPFDRESLIASVRKTHRFMLVHESWQSCSMGGWLISSIMNDVFFDLDAPPTLYAAPDTPIPFAPELEALYRPGRDGIFARIEELLKV